MIGAPDPFHRNRLLFLADVIDGVTAPPPCLDGVTLDMNSWAHCVAGYAFAMVKGRRADALDTAGAFGNEAMDVLITEYGMERHDVEELCMTTALTGENGNWTVLIDKHRAAAVVRHYARTGIVDWTIGKEN